MVVTCPSCSSKYQISEEKLGGKPKRIRCRSCKEVFIIHPPKSPSEPEGPSRAEGRDQGDEKAARFARVLASDMLVYNQDAVEKARVDGSLAEVMAGDLKRSWDLWKTRFPEAAQGQGIEIFRKALRSILAAGNDDFDHWTPED